MMPKGSFPQPPQNEQLTCARLPGVSAAMPLSGWEGSIFAMFV
jgi:hypothetical protein